MTVSERKVVLITGSTQGLGRAVARSLAGSGYIVLVHGRSRDRGDKLTQEIRASGGEAHFYQADLASLAQARQLGEAVGRDHSKLHLLINNAGIGVGGKGSRRETSVDGHELRFAVNYLAGYALTRLLLPVMLKSAPARVINVSSAGQYPIDFENVMLTRAYSGMRAYAQSKLAQVMFTLELANEMEDKGISVNCLHPASYMNTRMVEEAGATPMSPVEEGMAAVLNLATSPEYDKHTGLYLDGKARAKAHAQAYDMTARGSLIGISAQLTGLN